MAGTDATVDLPVVNPVGQQLDADSLTIGGKDVRRERQRLGGAAATELCDVRNAAPIAGDYGAVVRPIGLVGNLDGPATWQAVPTGAADLIATTCRLIGLHFVNTTNATITVTLKDKAGPLTVLSLDIPAKSVLDLPWHGTIFSGGLNWVASAAGLLGSVVAYQ